MPRNQVVNFSEIPTNILLREKWQRPCNSIGTYSEKGNVNFESEKLIFKISTFDFDPTTKGFELGIETEAPKPEYTGKPRGRKPKATAEAE